MRRLLILAAFLLTISTVPVCAQRGGHASGGSHGGFTGGHGGFAGHSGFVGHASGGAGMGSSHFSSHMGPLAGAHYASGSRYGSFGRGDHGYFRGRFHRDGFRNSGCYGCLAYGYPYYGFYDPYWWWDSYSSYDEDAARDRQLASEMNQENLEEQRVLRDQDQGQYARPMARQRDAQSSSDARAANDPPTVLVFRDQHQREIQNYAIVGQTIWNFAQQRTEKIPFSAIDIPATVKANDDRGVDFRLPGSSEGQ